MNDEENSNIRAQLSADAIDHQKVTFAPDLKCLSRGVAERVCPTADVHRRRT